MGVLFRLLFLCQVIDLTTLFVQGVQLDLTYDFDNTTLYWPSGQKNFELNILQKGFNPIGFWYQGDEYSSGVHGGTHMDAPNHFAKDGLSVDQVPLNKLSAPAVVVDIRPAASRSPDTNLTLADLHAWETSHGRIPAGSVVLQCSGWTSRYPNKSAVFGNDRDDTTDFHFPGFHAEAVEWLIDQRQIVGIGVDTPSMDYGQSSTFPTHVILAANGLYGLENVKDTCAVPAAGATINSYPSKLVGASGAPVRIIVEWDTGTDSAMAVIVGSTSVGMIALILIITKILD